MKKKDNQNSGYYDELKDLLDKVDMPYSLFPVEDPDIKIRKDRASMHTTHRLGVKVGPLENMNTALLHDAILEEAKRMSGGKK